jgi:hypothetical protein
MSWMPKNILPKHMSLDTNALSQISKITLTILTEQRDWLRDQPEIDISKLLQQAIRNQMMKGARKI